MAFITCSCFSVNVPKAERFLTTWFLQMTLIYKEEKRTTEMFGLFYINELNSNVISIVHLFVPIGQFLLFCSQFAD